MTAPRTPLAVLAALLLAAPAARAQGSPLDGLDAYVAQAVRDWKVPGLAIAVVKDDSVVFAKGYGVRVLGRPEPVGAHTLFAAASTTKAFTTTALAMLVDEGKLAWDDPVVRHLPGFQLADPYVTRELTVRDLVTHRSGLPTADLLWYGSPNTTNDVVRRLRFLPQAAGLRSRYAYNNNAYAVAGEVVEAASGMPWDEFVRARILRPLGMDGTLTGLAGLPERPDVAAPHVEVGDSIRPVPHRSLESIGPAGSMNSSVADMAKWMRFQLDSARAGGRRLVDSLTYREMFTPQFLVPAASYYPAARLAKPAFTAYGLGWFLQDYRGRKVAMHTGSIDGMSAILGLVPEERVGVVVFANLDHAELRHALMYRVFDAYLGGPPRDWSTELRALYGDAAERSRAAARGREAGRVRGTRPALPLSAYAGSYADSAFGRVEVRVEGGRLVARYGPAFTGPLEHWHHDVFRARWDDATQDPSLFTFVLDGARRRVESVQVEGIATFRRDVPAPAP